MQTWRIDLYYAAEEKWYIGRNFTATVVDAETVYKRRRDTKQADAIRLVSITERVWESRSTGKVPGAVAGTEL